MSRREGALTARAPAVRPAFQAVHPSGPLVRGARPLTHHMDAVTQICNSEPACDGQRATATPRSTFAASGASGPVDENRDPRAVQTHHKRPFSRRAHADSRGGHADSHVWTPMYAW